MFCRSVMSAESRPNSVEMPPSPSPEYGAWVFRARVGLADVHPGQYLNEGVELTTLQGVSQEVHVDFAVAQSVAAP